MGRYSGKLISQFKPVIDYQLCTLWNCNCVPFAPFSYNSVIWECAGLKVYFSGYTYQTPAGTFGNFNLNTLQVQSFALHGWPGVSVCSGSTYGISVTNGNPCVTNITYTSPTPNALEVRYIFNSASYSVSEYQGFSTLTDLIEMKEKVLSNGCISGESHVNGNLVIHWGSILFTVITFVATA